MLSCQPEQPQGITAYRNVRVKHEKAGKKIFSTWFPACTVVQYVLFPHSPVYIAFLLSPPGPTLSKKIIITILWP